MLDEPSLPTSGYLASSHCGMVAGLRDNVQSRFTIVKYFPSLPVKYFSSLLALIQFYVLFPGVPWLAGTLVVLFLQLF